ncbi:hypothetical protein LDENG_00209830 [Lucifuga dentata]|nr:hypothetical protein LDENG_00209830 [Lucifuga dentata]
MGDFTPEFTTKLQKFYKRLFLPPELKTMRNSLCVRPWDDVLLVSVLKGQNVTGIRKDKGKKDLLTEQMHVIFLRTELLQQQGRYRELCHYLRVVHPDDPNLFQEAHDLIPFCLCKEGDFISALHSFSYLDLASRFTPSVFLVYLRIFDTATAPNLTISHLTQLCHPDAVWEPIKGAVRLRRAQLLKFALRVQRSCPAVYADSQCWAQLLTIFNTPFDAPTLPAPSRAFLQVYSEQALLLLVTGALSLRIIAAPLSPALPVLNTYKENIWAFAWLCDSLASNVECLSSLLMDVRKEMTDTTGMWK